MSKLTDNHQTLWHVPEWCKLRFLKWPSEEEVVVLQPASGDIHLISLPVVALLESLQSNALSTSAILGNIESDDAMDIGISTKNDLERHFLRPLQHLGLVETTVETIVTTAENNTA